MCGYCKGYYDFCDVCSETIDLIGKIRSEGCFKCQICDCGTICVKCTNDNIIYCSCCVLDDNLLEESIEKLQKLIKELEFHKQFYTELKIKEEKEHSNKAFYFP